MKKCANQDCDICKYANGGFFVSNQKYCFECGSKLVEAKQRHCQCGQLLLAGHKFCTGCGRSCEEAMKFRTEEEEVVELVRETTKRLLKDANMSLPPKNDICPICKSPLKLNESDTCRNCGRYL